MSSRGPPRKKRKVSSNKTPSRTSTATTESQSVNTDGLFNQVQSIVTAILPGIIPAITQSVVSSLTQMGLIPKATASTESDTSPAVANSASVDIEQEAMPSTSGDKSDSEVRNSDGMATSSADTSTNADLPASKFVSMARPLGLGVDPKIKGKIWANQFVELQCLLPSKKNEKFEVVDNGDGFMKLKKSNSGSIKSFDRWLEAFHTFVAIYSSKFPHETANLMKHATIVQRLSKQAGDEAALSYDENFRIWRQDNPEYLPWGQLNGELQNEALAMGLCRKQNLPFHAKAKQNNSGKQICFNYNNNNGHCTRPNCPFPHKCQKCSGPHSKKQCNSKPAGADTNPKRVSKQFSSTTSKSSS